MNRQEKWDRDYLALAKFWANLKSKDPSTKVGAIVVSNRNKVVGMGYNGFPVGVNDTPERYANREEKYARVVHAEPNAVLDAGHEARGGTIYTWPFFSCNECAKLVIQSGIKRVVSLNMDPGSEEANARWEREHRIASSMYQEADVDVVFWPA